MNIAVFGLGKLGSPMVAVFAAAGHTVIGVDVNERYVEAVNKGQAPVEEPGLQALLTEHQSRISATTNGYDAAKLPEAIFIVVPTPSREDGLFDNNYICECLRPIGEAILYTGEPKRIIITSTVVPRGTVSSMASEILPALRFTGVPYTKFDLLYNPEFIALGTVIHDMRHPDYILIGGRLGACKWLATFWEGIVLNNPPVHCMTWLNAELTKILQNVLVTQKVSAANMVGNICERFPGADAQAVLRAIGDDRRIGQAYLQAATAYGGPCFPRDARALSQVARAVGAPAYMAGATRVTNDHQTTNLVNRVLGFLEDLPERTVAVLGLTYKPGTSVCDDSAAIQLVNALSDAGLDVLAYDPSGHREASHCVSSAVRLAESMEECISGAAVVVIAVPWPEFADLDPTWLERANYRPVVLDCWRMYKPTFFAAAADYAAPGLGTG